MSARSLQRTIPSVETADGAGVTLRRSLGKDPFSRLDPFLMLDAFGSDDPDDYIAGFPPHPHRGFETVTYMVEGHFRHEDSLGHSGELKSGGIQWMTAGRGIIHSEMPLQDQGRLRGFQLWLNLPARDKMIPAGYRNVEAENIPVVPLAEGGWVKVIAGTFAWEGQNIAGPIQGRPTEPLYLDVFLPAGGRFDCAVAPGHNAFLYPFEGQVSAGSEGAENILVTHVAGSLGPGDSIAVTAKDGPARFLVLAGKPLGEPVVQYGPFVMNTREEIEQAVADYRSGTLAQNS